MHPGAHEGYVDWERSEAIRAMIKDNSQGGGACGAAKRGDALLAGILRCRRCGRKLTVRYTGNHYDVLRYACDRGWLDNGEPRCIAFGGLPVDAAIGEQVLKPSIQDLWRQPCGWIARRLNAVTMSVRRSGAIWRPPDMPPIEPSAVRRCRSAEPAGHGGTGGALEPYP